MHDVKVF
jgi:serine/threonine-protein kinase CTR1